MEIRGPARDARVPACQKKLCFVATDLDLRAEVLAEPAERPDCQYIKDSLDSRDGIGMDLGRCFLTDEREIGKLWAELKPHPRRFGSIQDDDFTAAFRPND